MTQDGDLSIYTEHGPSWNPIIETPPDERRTMKSRAEFERDNTAAAVAAEHARRIREGDPRTIYRIEIEIDGLDHGDWQSEISRMLIQAGYNLPVAPDVGDRGVLRDINGNARGRWYVA